MDQGGGLQCLPWLFPGQLRGGELSQLVIDQRQQLLGGSRVASFDLGENSSNLFHHRFPFCVLALTAHATSSLIRTGATAQSESRTSTNARFAVQSLTKKSFFCSPPGGGPHPRASHQPGSGLREAFEIGTDINSFTSGIIVDGVADLEAKDEVDTEHSTLFSQAKEIFDSEPRMQYTVMKWFPDRGKQQSEAKE